MAIRRRKIVKSVDTDFKILWLKDPHFRFGFKYPSGRKDTYFEEIEAKIDNVIRIGKERNITKLGIAGDIFDIKQPSLWSGKAVTKNHKILMKLREQFDIYTIAGNHDLIGSARSNKPQSMYSHFVESGLLIDIHDKPQKFGDTYLYGIDFNSDISQLKREIKAIDSKAKSIKVKNPKAKVILMFHEHCIAPEEKDKVWGSSFNYRYVATNYKNIDVFSAGHYHKGYDTQTYRGKVFINPFNFSRLARSHYTLDGSHIPTAVELVISDKGIKYEDIPLTHRPFNESIDIEVMMKELKQEMDIGNFLSTVEDFEDITEDEMSLDSLPIEVKNKIEHYIELSKN